MRNQYNNYFNFDAFPFDFLAANRAEGGAPVVSRRCGRGLRKRYGVHPPAQLVARCLPAGRQLVASSLVQREIVAKSVAQAEYKTVASALPPKRRTENERVTTAQY